MGDTPTDELTCGEIHVFLRPTNVQTRWPCAVCSNHTEKDMVLAEFKDLDGVWHVVCEECLKAGVEAIPARLEEKARGLEVWASDLRACAKLRWILPSHEEWIEANKFDFAP